MPKISIIINCHNGEEFLKETLNALEEQTYSDFEIIFYDNFSTDSSAKIANTFDSRLKYYKSNDFISLGAARNKALDFTTGDYIAFCDCDDIWDSEKLAKQVDELDNDETVGMVFTNFKRLNMINGLIDIFDKKAEYKKLDFAELVCNYSFCLSSFLIRRSALSELDHCFNEAFQYAEEFELFSRIAYHWKTIYLPEPFVVYRIHKNMTTLKVEERIGIEYGLALDNLRKMSPDIDSLYPDVIKEISFRRDFTKAKYLIKFGNNKMVRVLTRPYMFYNIRAFLFFIIALGPKSFSTKIVSLFYKQRI